MIGFSNLGVSVLLICLSHASLHAVLSWGHHQEQETDVGPGIAGCGVQGVCVWWGWGWLALSCENFPCARGPYWYWGKETERFRDRTVTFSPKVTL